MPSTSIQVRGKRKAPSSSPRHSDTDGEQRPAKIKRSIGQIKASRLANPRTKLESLPTEVLEDVLLYSLNVALPRCSHLIGAKLSDRATLIRFCLAAFDKTWDRHLGGKSKKATPTKAAKTLSDDIKDAKVEVQSPSFPSQTSWRLTRYLLIDSCARYAVGQTRSLTTGTADMGQQI